MYKLNIYDYVSFHTCTKSNKSNQKKLYFTSNFKKIVSNNANISEGKAKTNRKQRTKAIRIK